MTKAIISDLTNEELINAYQDAWIASYEGLNDCLLDGLKAVATLARTPKVIPLSEWHEEDGNVLWWKFPVDEPPYVGTPLDNNWPGYHTHFTFLQIPNETTNDL